eukprot:scpid14498/ scgid30310/ 
MLEKLLPDYTPKYKLVWCFSVVLLIASTGLVIFFQTCYSEAAHSSELQGEPWYTAMHDQSTLAKNWATSAVCVSCLCCIVLVVHGGGGAQCMVVVHGVWWWWWWLCQITST